MYEIQAFLPGEDEPTDLAGYADYLTAGVALETPLQYPDYILLVDGGDRTEIGAIG